MTPPPCLSLKNIPIKNREKIVIWSKIEKKNIIITHYIVFINIIRKIEKK